MYLFNRRNNDGGASPAIRQLLTSRVLDLHPGRRPRCRGPRNGRWRHSTTGPVPELHRPPHPNTASGIARRHCPVPPVRGRRRTGTGESSAPIWRCRWRSIGWALWDVWPLAYSAELGGVHVVIASRLSGEIRSWPRSDRLLEVLDDCSDEAVEMTLEVGAWRLRERGADSRSARDDIKCRVRQRLRAEVVAPVAGCGT